MKRLIGGGLAALAIAVSVGAGLANACPCVEGETRSEPGIGNFHSENGQWHHGPYGYHPGEGS